MKNSKRILAAATALILTLSAGCKEKKEEKNKIVYYDDSNSYSQNAEGVDSNDGDSSGEDIEEDETIDSSLVVPAKMNEKVQVAGVDITLKNIYYAGEYEYEEERKKQVLAVNCDITNSSDSDVNVNSFNFKIRNVDGENVQIETGMLDIMTSGDNITGINQLNNKIKPGETVSGYASISTYPEWQTLTIYFTPSGQEEKHSISFEITKDMVEEQ